MVSRGWLWVVAGVVGCGPAVGTPEPGAETSSSGATEAGTAPPVSESGVDPNPSTTLTTSTTTDTGSSTGVDTSSDGGSTSEYECGCPPNIPIEFEDVLERGFTPADAIAEFDDATLAFEWIGYPEQPATMLHLGVAYTGGAVAEGPGGSDGCAFLSMPCHDGVVMEVTLTLSTADGWVIWTTPAELTGVVDGSADYVELSLAAEGDASENTGSLAEQPPIEGGMPSTIAAMHFDATRFVLDGAFHTGAALLGSFLDDGGPYELGRTPEPP